LSALIDEFERLGVRPERLLEARVFGETVSDELRQQCRERLGVPLTDVYSSQEVGPIAAMCPESGLYHVHAESLIVEVLDEAGQPCKPGETGRVVITDLHNFATPLLRYEIRDYAEVGPQCPCGRGLPTLRRIVGRERNLMRLPSGKRSWGFFGSRRFRDVADVKQFQVVQHSLQDVEVRLVVANALTSSQEEHLRKIVRETMGHPFDVRFTLYPDEIPRSAGGKYEEFLCRIDH
jgi:phenylacetate-CoA ligase